MPLYANIPTDFSNLYHSLKLAQGINVAVSVTGKTIATLDLQLYSKCMQMRENEEIKKNFIFRHGELHIVFAFLKVIGKYIQGSGIDQVLIEAGIYGTTTLGQILQGKHMKRAMEAHMVIYLSLCKIYLEQVFQKHPERKTLREIISSLLQINLEEVKMDHVKAFVTALKNDGILEAFQTFDQNLQQEVRFLRNYMIMYEILLHFVRANREGDWQLHLTKAVLPESSAAELSNYRSIGQDLYEPMKGEASLWSTIRKRNLKTSRRSQIDQEERRGKGSPTQRREHFVIPFSNRSKEAN